MRLLCYSLTNYVSTIFLKEILYTKYFFRKIKTKINIHDYYFVQLDELRGELKSKDALFTENLYSFIIEIEI